MIKVVACVCLLSSISIKNIFILSVIHSLHDAANSYVAFTA